MNDIRFNDEYCVVSNGDEIIQATKMTGRVETNHKIEKFDTFEEVPEKYKLTLQDEKDSIDIAVGIDSKSK